MNYYEQFYDDLEFMDCDDGHYRHGYDRNCRRDYYNYEEADRFYGGYGHPSRAIPYQDDNFDRERGHAPYYNDEYYDRGLPPSDFGRGSLLRSGQFERAKGPRERGRVRGSIFPNQGRGRGNAYPERGRGRGQGGPQRVKGVSENRNWGQGREADRVKSSMSMNFIKAGEDLKGSIQETASRDNKSDNEGGSSAVNKSNKAVDGQPVRLEDQNYQAHKTKVQKEVEAALKALGQDYGYGPRTDLVEEESETPNWYGHENDPDATQATFEHDSARESETVEQTVTYTESQVDVAPKNEVKKAMLSPVFNFVKANIEFKSTDVAFHETEEIKPKPNSLSVNMGNKRIGLGFGTSARGESVCEDISSKFHAGMKNGMNAQFDRKFQSLHEAVKVKNLPNKNGIEILHMAVDRVKMLISDDIRSNGRTRSGQPMFMSRLEIDGVFVAEGVATAKKAAKHEAYANAVKLLMNPNLTVQETSTGVFEVKVKDTEFKTPAAPDNKTGPQSSVENPTSKSNGSQLYVASVNSKASDTTTSKPATVQAYPKPKIVFHKSSHPLSDKTLKFKTPTTQPSVHLGFTEKKNTPPATSGMTQISNQPFRGVQNPEQMAIKLLNFVKEGDSASKKDSQSATVSTTCDSPKAQKSGLSQNFQKYSGLVESRGKRSMSSTTSRGSLQGIKRPAESQGSRTCLKYNKKGFRKATNELHDLSQFIIIDNTSLAQYSQMVQPELNILHNSSNLNKVVLKVEYENFADGFNCSIFIADHPVASSFGLTKDEAKQSAAKLGLLELRGICYTIKVKQDVDNDSIGLTKEELMSDIKKSSAMLPDSNVGNMLLKKMGWSGGGVGKSGQGIAEPVKTEMVIGRQGLGLKASFGMTKEFNQCVTKILEDYIKSGEQSDIHFSSELTKEERAVIHNIGQKMGLKTQSKGKNNNRYLIVSRRRSVQELLDHVIESGGTTSKYEVIPPTQSDFDCHNREDVDYGHKKM